MMTFLQGSLKSPEYTGCNNKGGQFPPKPKVAFSSRAGLYLAQFLVLFMLFFSISNLFAQQVIGAGHYDGVTVTTSDNSTQATGEETLNGEGLLPSMTAASRFLGQATLGADYETIETLAQGSIEDWIDAQLALPVTFSLQTFVEDKYDDLLDSLILYGESTEDVTPYGEFWQYGWWTYTMTTPDVLRQRMALALSEIFVISEQPDLNFYPYAMSNYYDMLLQHAFGNYRELLEDVTLHPAMGVYLTHMNNPRAEPAENRFPDENYAREIMQLFSIGLYELNLDGSRMQDNEGNDIPTYNNFDIAELAKVFTGFSWASAPYFYYYGWGQEDFIEPMQMFNDWHEPGAKTIVGNYTIPARNPVDGMADVEDALDHLANHPNVAPFISLRLIQRLVKSNPSPEYITRVATVFNDNGQGVKGDFAAVLKAILMDKEARDCSFISDPHHGMLREPLVRHTHISRAFNVANQVGTYYNPSWSLYDVLEQRALAAPSVFNFFRPDYQPLGPIADAGLVAPEFQITNSRTTIGYADMLHYWAWNSYDIMDYGYLHPNDNFYAERVMMLDLTDELALADEANIGDLVERLNLILLHGNMSETTRTAITDVLSQMPSDEDWREERVRMALYLAMMSPDYLIMR